MKRILISILLLFFLFYPHYSFAESPYVLPYPPVMPGSMWYKIRLLGEFFDKYWYFGNISQFKYNFELSDKYLVQAKTLFEYKQYLLGYSALQKSNTSFKEAQKYLTKAKNEGKDVSDKESIFTQAIEKHREVLLDMQQNVPEIVNWSPEKSAPTILQLHSAIENAIKLRN